MLYPPITKPMIRVKLYGSLSDQPILSFPISKWSKNIIYREFNPHKKQIAIILSNSIRHPFSKIEYIAWPI